MSVRSPLVIPIHSGIASFPNRFLLRAKIDDWMRYEGKKILWTYTPVTYGLEAYADSVVYHCVDLLGTFPGINRKVIERGERKLAACGVQAVATSRIVQSHLQSMGYANVILWENVADVEVIKTVDPAAAVRVPGRVIFAGNLSPSKVDYKTIEALADEGLDVRVAGPRVEGGGSDRREFSSLIEHGVEYLGQLPLEQLAVELSHATVGIIPYVINEYTLGVSPLKTYEYMAAGLSVVASPLPGVNSDEDGIWVESTRESFVARVKSLSQEVSADVIQTRLSAASRHSWDSRGMDIRSLVSRSLAR
jgi:glycosyltransferase involved in cell wall biosynthesis